jgi:hypothetical protein
MLVDVTGLAQGDAEALEHQWGVRVALEMLHDGLLMPTDFFWLW